MVTSCFFLIFCDNLVLWYTLLHSCYIYYYRTNLYALLNLYSILYRIKHIKTLSNKFNHILNGNINAIKILTWNKDKKKAIDCIERIEEIIFSNNADIILINEFNVRKTDDLSLINIKGFKIGLNKLYKSKGQARSVIYNKNTLSHTKCHHYENKNDSAIVIKVGFPNQKHFYIYGIYHQWSLLNDKESAKIYYQEARWKITLKLMSDVLNKNEECYLIGDINLNTLAFYKLNDQKTSHEKKLTNMYNMFIELINTYNLICQNKEIPTRGNSILDVIYTNRPTKVNSYKIGINKEGSDHSPVIIARSVNNI